MSDDFTHGRSQQTTSVVVGGARIPLSAGALGSLPTSGRFDGTLAVPPSVAAATPTTAVGQVEEGSDAGDRLAAALATAGRPVAITSGQVTPSSSEAVVDPPTAHHAYVARMTNAGTYDISPTQIQDVLTTSLDFWVEQSDGVISSFDVAESTTFTSAYAAGPADCGLDGQGSEGEVWSEAAALFPGVDFDSSPNHLIVLVPDECTRSGLAGIAELGDSLSHGGRVIGNVEGYGTAVLSHEVGHNVGLLHAHADGLEYGDYYSVMGGPPSYDASRFTLPVLNTAQREKLDLIQPGEVADVWLPPDQASGDRTVTLSPRGAVSGVRAARVFEPDSGAQVLVEYRSAAGREAGTFYAAGTLAGRRLGPGLTVLTTTVSGESDHLLDGGTDFALEPGETIRPDGTPDLTITVTSMDASGLTAAIHFAPQLPAWPQSFPVPVLTGTPEVAQSVSVDVGSWPTGVGHQVTWFADANVEHPAPQGLDLYLTHKDAGATLHAIVASSDSVHRAWIDQTGSVGPVVQRVQILHPQSVSTVSPPEVGVPVVSSGAAVYPYGSVVALQWAADGIPIPGATGISYTPTTADVGRRLSVVTMATYSGYLPATAVSALSAPVVDTSGPPVLMIPVGHTGPGTQHPATLTAARPRIVGPVEVGARLLARPGRWTPGATLHIRWVIDGKAVRHATKRTWRVPVSARGRRVTVRVTGTLAGYRTRTTTSRPSARVR